MWTTPFTDELSVLYKQAGVDEELPTSNMDKVHEVLGGRNTAVNYPNSDSGDPVTKYFGKVERNLPTNNAAESV